MALDAYAPCPCGSGKKFKWCCQPIHIQIDKAFRQDEEGQHDAAVRIMDEVVAQNPANPEAWGRKAHLLYLNNRVDEAETTLQKALEINPQYPFGHFLQGIFRQQEGEIAGALMLFRKAIAYYDPDARENLAQLYALIGENEFKLNRPVAARAALKMALHYQPANEGLRKNFDSLMGDQSFLPAAARREYVFQGLPSMADPSQRQAWDRVLENAATGKLSDAVTAFEQLTRENPESAPAWFNLALVRAWSGDNRPAVEALDRYVTLETDESRAVAAWTLAEVLRCGHGMEADTDYIDHALLFQIRQPEALATLLREWETSRRLIGVQASEDQPLLTGLVLEQGPALTPELARTHLPGVAGYLMIIGDRLRLSNTNRQALERLREEVQQRLGPALSSPHTTETAAKFNEILAEALVFPIHIADKDEAQRRVQEHIQQFFEEKWIHRVLRSLNMIPPVDAAGHPVLRKKLLGVIQFLQDCFTPGALYGFDFDRLRRKLGLIVNGQAGASQAGADIGAMSAAELAGLGVDTLADEAVEKAYQTALELDARQIASRFAKALVSRPARPGIDRFPWYIHLIQQALSDGDVQSALDYVNEGEKADCENNEGRRRNDYELRRAQILAKRGETDEARNVFERLIERVPSELRFRSSAAEAMLSANQSSQALHFAEGGLAKAREQNNRDSENHFMELVGAAKKRQGN
jgi:tetratricopeptide (TPR) repeat protein